MKKVLLVSLGIVALAVPIVIAQQAGQQDRTQERMGMRGQHEVGQFFLKNAIQNNMFEQEVAKLVEQKAPDPQVKQFAQKLQESHKQTLDQLKQVAERQQMQVPTRIETWQQDKLQALRQINPENLQAVFLFGTVGQHHTSILMHKWAAEKAQKEEVKSIASRRLPELEQQLKEADQLTQQVTGISAAPAGVTGR